jgi:hypothetical protein
VIRFPDGGTGGAVRHPPYVPEGVTSAEISVGYGPKGFSIPTGIVTENSRRGIFSSKRTEILSTVLMIVTPIERDYAKHDRSLA